MSPQSRTVSLIEQCVSTAIGYAVAVATQVLVFPWFGIHVAAHENLAIAGVFTLVSVCRGYLVRRLFNHLHGRLEALVGRLSA